MVRTRRRGLTRRCVGRAKALQWTLVIVVLGVTGTLASCSNLWTPGQPGVGTSASDLQPLGIAGPWGTVYAFGENSYGQLGLGDQQDRNVPTPIATLLGVKSVSAGGSHALFLRDTGEAYGCGYNEEGQLGLGNRNNYSVPASIRSGVLAIAAGEDHTLILRSYADVLTCGYNYNGQLGIGNKLDQLTPKQITTLSVVTAVAGGDAHSLVVTQSGDLYSFGWNISGQLGLGNRTDQLAPKKVTLPSGAKAVTVAGGFSYSLVLCSNGSVYAFGSNHGQFGTGQDQDSWVPVRVPLPSGAKAIAAGGYFSLFLLANGDVYSCGENDCGQLGLGDTKQRYVPTRVPLPAGTKCTAIAAGGWHSLIALDNGEAYAFGSNDNGQLGLGDKQDRASPVKISGLGWAVGVACGIADSFVIVGSSPPNVSASKGTYSDKVSVSWSAVSGATSYDVYRADSAAGTYSKIGTATVAPYDDTGASQNGTHYWYKVRAYNGTTYSDYSLGDEGWRGMGPDVPLNVSASDGSYSDKVSVSWSAVSGATSYDVYRATTAGGLYSKLGSTNGTSYDDKGASSGGTHYWYKVKAYNGTTYSDYSSADEGWRNPGSIRPIPPGNVSASNGMYRDKVSVSWSAVSGATSYDVYRATSAGGGYSKLGSTNGTSYDDKGASSSGTHYWYKVKAYNGTRYSDFSLSDEGWRDTALNLPGNVSASNGTYRDKVRVRWSAVSGATSYEIYRAISAGGSYSKVGSTNGTSHDDKGASSSGTHYWYKVKAYNGTRYSDFSSSDEGWRSTVPNAPLNVGASKGTYSDKVRVSWSAVAGATSYYIYRATRAGGSYSKVGSTNGTSYDDRGASSSGTHYWYKVKAYNGTAYSDYSGTSEGWRKKP